MDIFANSLLSGVTVFFSLGLENIYSFLFRATRSHARTKIKMPKSEQGRLCYMRDFCIFCFSFFAFFRWFEVGGPRLKKVMTCTFMRKSGFTDILI